MHGYQCSGRSTVGTKQMSAKASVCVLVCVILIALSGCGKAAATPGAKTAEPTPSAVQADGRIAAEARVVPARYARLSVATGGIVTVVPVAEGQQVVAGQTLLKIDSARQAAAVAQAEAQLHRAEAGLAQLKVAPREEERRSAQASVDAAQARLKRLQTGPQPAEIAAARATVAEAEAALQRTLEGPGEQQLIAARTDVLNAEALVRQAQAAYDRVKGEANIGARPEALQLEQATNQYNAARARLSSLQDSTSAADIAGARARVQRSQAQLDLLTTVNPADIAAAEAEVRRAQAGLDLLAVAARPEAVAAAEADIEAARASITQARAALAETELKAPFAGVLAVLNARVGEQVLAGTIVVQLADFSTWQVETDDLTEINIVRVNEGATASLTFDAIPGLRLTGKVVRIKPLGENKQGDITYTVVIQPDQQDPRLRWNMTAAISIEP